jgi:hydroxymethylpyrimidine kinase / phosphomethylpyrimidine kinase / thiamine-phosphate diphosphorylase
MSDKQTDLNFASCASELGLYPIVDRALWLARLLPLGVKVIQLRVKDLSGDELKTEILQCVKIANEYDCQLYINDYWQLAIECGAYGVHLGQEDIDDADLSAIANAGLRLGLSSHCFYEVARAKTIKPSYIAFGPVYATQTKDMPWVPQGETGLPYWRAQLVDFPLVAIGGIHGERFEKVKAQGVDSIAMISAITEAENPEQVCKDFIERWNI